MKGMLFYGIPFLFFLVSSGMVRAVIVERIVAVVNNDLITLSELDDIVDAIHGTTLDGLKDVKEREAKRQELRKMVLEQMIGERVLTQQYDRLQIIAGEEDIDSAIDHICRQNSITLEVLKAELVRQGLTYSEYRDRMRQHILQTKFVEQQIRPRINVSEEDLKHMYTRQLGEVETQEVAELMGVLVLLPRGGSPESIEAAKRKALVVRGQLLDGRNPDDISAEYSDGSVTSLGEMGRFRPGELMEQLDRAVFSLKAGAVTEPIEAAQGLYLIKVKSIGPGVATDVASYEEARDQLMRRYYDEQVEVQLQVFIHNARKDAHVELLL